MHSVGAMQNCESHEQKMAVIGDRLDTGEMESAEAFRVLDEHQTATDDVIKVIANIIEFLSGSHNFYVSQLLLLIFY